MNNYEYYIKRQNTLMICSKEEWRDVIYFYKDNIKSCNLTIANTNHLVFNNKHRVSFLDNYRTNVDCILLGSRFDGLVISSDPRSIEQYIKNLGIIRLALVA